jgi:hypothetical protein
VPRHVARLVTRLVAPLVVDYSASHRLVVDYFASTARPGVKARRAARHATRRTAPRRLPRLVQARPRLLRLRRASGCHGTSSDSSHGSSLCSSSTTLPRAGSSRGSLLVVDYSTSRRLVVDYFAYAVRTGASARRAARHAARRAARRRLLRLAQARVDYSASRRLVADYFASASHQGASARCAARRAARRRLLCVTQARRRLLRLLRASGCLGMSRGSSLGSSCRSSTTTPPHAGSSLTTSPPPHIRVSRHVARLVAPLVVNYSVSRRLVVDYFASAVRPGASARRAARHVARRVACRRVLCLTQARRGLLRLRRASGCLGTSRGSSCGLSRRSSSTTPPRAGSSSITPPRAGSSRGSLLVVEYSASRRLVIDYFASAVRPGASAHRATRHACRRAARRRLLHLA